MAQRPPSGSLILSREDLDSLFASRNKLELGEGLCDLLQRVKHARMGQDIEQDRLVQAAYPQAVIPYPQPQHVPQTMMPQAAAQPVARGHSMAAGIPIPRLFSAAPIAPATNVIPVLGTVIFRGVYNWSGLIRRVRIGIADGDLGRLAVGPFTVAGLPIIDGANQITGSSYGSQNQCCIDVHHCISTQQEVLLSLTNLDGANALTVSNPTFEVEPLQACQGTPQACPTPGAQH